MTNEHWKKFYGSRFFVMVGTLRTMPLSLHLIFYGTLGSTYLSFSCDNPQQCTTFSADKVCPLEQSLHRPLSMNAGKRSTRSWTSTIGLEVVYLCKHLVGLCTFFSLELEYLRFFQCGSGYLQHPA